MKENQHLIDCAQKDSAVVERLVKPQRQPPDVH